MAKKLTKRLGFHFMRSYFDVLNEIPEDEDKLYFLLAIINKQFLDENPDSLNFITNLCYESQRHAIEKSVKGWKTASKTDLLGNPIPPLEGNPTPPLEEVQEEVQEEVEEEYLYSDKSFLESWEKARKHYLKKPTHIKKLDFNESNYFKNLIKDYTPEEIKTGIYGLFKQKNKNISSMYLKPKHFLENFVKYYNAELSKDYELYGKGEKLKEQL